MEKSNIHNCGRQQGSSNGRMVGRSVWSLGSIKKDVIGCYILLYEILLNVNRVSVEFFWLNRMGNRYFSFVIFLIHIFIAFFPFFGFLGK